jgi:uncharacterized membrane protein
MEPTKRVSPKDVFLHLLAIITLYASAISFVNLIFAFINLKFSDTLNGGYYYSENIYSSVRLAVATLIVVFPTYAITTRFLNKEYLANPEKRNLRIRKWLVYFTLFATGLIAIGDVITLIYNLLNGDITSHFILKVMTILFVTSSIFYYYFMDLKKYRTE